MNKKWLWILAAVVPGGGIAFAVWWYFFRDADDEEDAVSSDSDDTDSSEDVGDSGAPDDIGKLGLAGYADSGARSLREAFGAAVVFTSGRRNGTDAGRAMAQNVYGGGKPKWIQQTYRHRSNGSLASPLAQSLQDWVDAHPSAKTADAAAAFAAIINGASDDVKNTLSSHFSGRAFDVKPMTGEKGDAVQAAINALPGLDRFLTKEGGLVRWHAQFKAGEPNA
jgi:hypothetical protein